MRILIALAFALILISLGSALFYLMRDRGTSNKTVRALALRVGLSIALFLFLIVAGQMGWIQSTGIRY
ncbi:MAG: twin transmembrane helix small protein [Burkholderiaceae bacterium]|nr:twin transmembrane helix small protein [Burkholderiaceae bacterium]